MKTRIVQDEPNDPVSGGASATPAGQAADVAAKPSDDDSYERVSSFRTSS